MRSRPTVVILVSMCVASLVLIFTAWESHGLWQDLAVNLAAGLIGTVLTFWVFDIYLRDVNRSAGVPRDGIDYHKFIRQAKRAKRCVRIWGTFVYLLEEPDHLHGFREALYHALQTNEGMSAKILLLDPFSNAAKQRQADRGPNEDVVKRTQANLVELAKLCGDPVLSSVDVRVYDFLPTLSLFQWDETASMSFYPRGGSVSEAERLEFSMDTPLGRFVDDAFEMIWEDAKTKPLREYMHLPVRVRNPLTDEYDEYGVPFVKTEGTGVFYLLLNRLSHRWAWALSEELPLRVVWNGNLRSCSVQHVDQEHSNYEWIVQSAVSKYHTVDFQRVIAAKMAASQQST